MEEYHVWLTDIDQYGGARRVETTEYIKEMRKFLTIYRELAKKIKTIILHSRIMKLLSFSLAAINTILSELSLESKVFRVDEISGGGRRGLGECGGETVGF